MDQIPLADGHRFLPDGVDHSPPRFIPVEIKRHQKRLSGTYRCILRILYAKVQIQAVQMGKGHGGIIRDCKGKMQAPPGMNFVA